MNTTTKLTQRHNGLLINIANRILQEFRVTALGTIALVISFTGILPLLVSAPAIAAAGTPCLYRGQALAQNQSLVSPNGQNWVIMQGDGNLVIYAEGNSVAPWSTSTAGHPGAHAVMQTDGNFVVYSPGGQALWLSHTYGSNPGAYVCMQSDGNLVIYNSANQALWWTGTTSTWHVGPVRQINDSFEGATAVAQARFQWNYHNVYIWGSTSCNASRTATVYAWTTWCGTAGNGSGQSMNAGMNVHFLDIISNYQFARWDRMNTDIYGNYWNTSGDCPSVASC